LLLSLLAEKPRHGYELIRLIEQMFGGISPDFMTTLAEVEELAAVELGRDVETMDNPLPTNEPTPLE